MSTDVEPVEKVKVRNLPEKSTPVFSVKATILDRGFISVASLLDGLQ
jgi:hypothetical protein